MLLSLLLLPLVGSLLVFLWKNPMSKQLALAVAFAQLAITFYMMFGFNAVPTVDGVLQHEIVYPWSKFIKSSIHFGVDGLSMLLLFLINLLIPLIILSAFNEKKSYPNSFFALILLMQFGLVGVFTAMDGLLFYVFWEITLIPIWFISGLWGQEDKRIKVTLKFFVYTFFGSLFMLVGLIYAYHYSASFELTDLYNAQLSTTQQNVVFWFIFLAFAVKFPLFPFHTWLPDAHTYAPTQGSMLLSGIMLKMAVYGVLRYLLPIAPEAVFGLSGKIVIVLSVIGILYGAIIAIVTNNVKTIIAYSSISHLGMMAAGIFASAMVTMKNSIAAGAVQLSIEGAEGALIQTMSHGINATGLFYCADILYKRFHTKDITQMGGMARVAPKFAVLFMIILLGSMGVPLTNGFVGEFTLLKSLFDFNIATAVIAGLSVVFGAVYMLRLYAKSMFGKGKDEVLKGITDVSDVEFSVLASLAAFVILFGLFPNYIMELANSSLQFIYSSLIK